MREIKFRVWDNKIKEYIVPEQFEILLLANDKKTPVCNLNLSNNIYDFYKAENIEVDMFTGLKDKKGKEIYEGDLVEISDSDDDIICQVKYEYGSFILEKGEYTEYLGEVEERFLEVVGNILENPELLGEEV